jgi:hypothetical protein
VNSLEDEKEKDIILDETAIKPTDESALKITTSKVDVDKYLSAYDLYKSVRGELNDKIIANENWFRQKYWQYMIDKIEGDEPTSGTLLNAILNKHADFMDNEPAPVFLAREKNDEAEAQKLSKVVPVILENAEFKEAYSRYCWYLIKNGVACLSATWDDTLENGLGDIVINNIDILRIYWEPNITDIQDSRYVFVESLIDTDILKEMYDLKNLDDTNTGAQEAFQIVSYETNDQNILANKTLVIDCYERTITEDERQVVHLTKIANGCCLESSLEYEKTKDKGIYAHGRYPFVIGQYVPLEGTLEGMGMIDIAKNSQAYIDKLDIISLKNSIVAGKQRYIVKKDGGINSNDLMDLSKDVIEASGNVDEKAIRALQATSLPNYVQEIRQNKISETKEVLANRDFNQGGTTGGVTAFGAIAALQEAGNKTTRDLVKGNYQTFKKLNILVIELIREFYTQERQFRIIGEENNPEYIAFSNANMINQITNADEAFIMLPDGTQIPNPEWEPEYRKPVYDIEVIAQKENPFNTISHNQIMIQLFELGALNPEAAIPATVLIENMIFDGKEKLLLKIKENGNLYNQVMQMQQQMQQMQAQHAQEIQGIQAQYGQLLEQQGQHIQQLESNIDKIVR